LVAALPGDRYVLGSTVMNLTGQATQLIGFAAGGVLVVAVGPRPVLLLDAVTFAAAGLLIRRFTPHRPATADGNSAAGATGQRSAPRAGRSAATTGWTGSITLCR
jgi:hypothetical protein